MRMTWFFYHFLSSTTLISPFSAIIFHPEWSTGLVAHRLKTVKPWRWSASTVGPAFVFPFPENGQEILKTKQFAVFTQSLQYLFFWFEEVFTQRFFSVKHQLSRMNSSGASDLITRRIQGWVEAEMLKMTWYYPYHPCMVYLPTFGWCLC